MSSRQEFYEVFMLYDKRLSAQTMTYITYVLKKDEAARVAVRSAQSSNFATESQF